MQVKGNDGAVTHDERRLKWCKSSMTGTHDFLETSRSIYDFIGAEVFVTMHCALCGMRRIDVDNRRE